MGLRAPRSWRSLTFHLHGALRFTGFSWCETYRKGGEAWEKPLNFHGNRSDGAFACP